jgi:hypothetical protein
MQPTIRPYTHRRALGAADLAGIAHLYPMLCAFTPAQLGARATAVIHGKVIASNYAIMSIRITRRRFFLSSIFP